MEDLFADRMSDVPRSFIREILKVTVDPSVISFAGGLPNRDLFPVREIASAAERVLAEDGRSALQYSNSEGYAPLREMIAERMKRRFGIDVPVERILITNGSQQGLDLLGKTLLNEGERVAIEEPGYLGAIQAFSLYRPEFVPVALLESGIDIPALKAALDMKQPKLLYTVPNFQNPSGITYDEETREALADALKATVLVEDDPYGELRFEGRHLRPMLSMRPGSTVYLGSFSKTIAPAFRIGWMVAPPALYDKLLIAKQASDLHTNYFTQLVIHRYILDNDLDAHIATITAAYGSQRKAMIDAAERHFPKSVKFTRPEGGMFLWATLPEGVSSLELFDHAIKDKVAFVPGVPFYTNGRGKSTLRLNFSCSDLPTIDEGMARLGRAMRGMC